MTQTLSRDVRRHLQQVTQDVHQALHHDPVLRRLSTPGLTVGEYASALRVFAVFYNAVERERVRCGVFARFSVQCECDALWRDLGGGTVPQALRIRGEMECLGALYVAHGASFGRGTFRANVTKSLLGHPHSFVRLATDKGRWINLIAELDRAGQSDAQRMHIQNGATRAFSFIQGVARAEKNALSPVQTTLD